MTQDKGEFMWRAKTLARALEYTAGTHTLDDVWTGIEMGALQMWVEGESIIITEVQQYPQLRAVHFFLAAGKMDEMEKLVPEIETWAREKVGASRITLAGRKGWERSFLAGRGYAPQWSVMSRNLENV